MYILLISMLVACIPVLWMQHYFFHQSRRQWLGLSYTVTSWQRVFELLETRFAYKKKDIENNLHQAGFYNPILVAVYFPAKIILTVVIIGVIFFFGEPLGLSGPNDQMVAGLLTLVIVVIGPDIWLQKRKNKRIRKVAGMMPYVIDLMAVCIQTGMTIEAAIAYLADELKGFDGDLARMMWKVNSRSRLVGMNKALLELQDDYPSDEMNSFVYTLSQSLQYGSSIYDVLIELSANIRDVQMLLLEEKVGKLSAKMSVPLILFIMFPIVILITAPGIMRMMSNGSFL
ncbi:type II secretion system F family protein [Sansalvadorimonas sp. 2012CJ34-2]|uniref:Type II secretion system F family protein n=1 Tax=Parendozoicomonas callyspongiae TaxID=2942213 RepID=A0ABT0PJL9_9GAMM|nr:type II secretion system F family protein [Sansalvadorimonas sp. 2012CJ34-2]MCL6271461.1 type II secretion system F family protein [Sansalvadorimonas sp. 2012CJ34-2]